MREKLRKLRFGSQAVHAGQRQAKPDFHSTSTPIYSTSTFYYDRAEEMDAVFGGKRPGYVYTRYGNPTVLAFEEAMSVLEGGQGAVALGSGMGAIHAALLAAGVRAGDTVLTSQDLYGSTYSLFLNVFGELGVKFVFADFTDLDSFERQLRGVRPKVVYMETLSNPLLKIIDLTEVANLTRQQRAILIVDSTFTTPYLLRPLEHNADVVLHSATKYLGGHGDVTGGVIVFSQDEQLSRARLILRWVGGVLGPFEAWLALRGLKTLPLRMQRQCDNALALARWLENDKRIAQVIYPGLESHPQHDLARDLFENGCFGAIVSFEVKDASREDIFRFLDALTLCGRATTLGDIYTQILYPAMSSHRELEPDKRKQLGISDSLLRVSLGIEDVQDIIEDIDRALSRAR